MQQPLRKLEDKQVKSSLKHSFLDGVFASGMVGLTQDYFAPFLIFLGGTARQVGALNSLTNLFSALVQSKSADFTRLLGSRKKLVVFFVCLQAMMLMPIIWFAHGASVPLGGMIVAITLFNAFGAFAAPAWGSWMSELVEEKKRGAYFGRRNRILGLLTVTISFVGGIILHVQEQQNLLNVFASLFVVAMLARFMSAYFLSRMHESTRNFDKADDFSFLSFLKRLKESNFAKFVFFVGSMNLCVNMAAPYFAVLMLKDLKFNYLQYVTLTITAQITACLLMERWGKVADVVGNLKIVRLTAPIIAVLPLLWVINQHPVFLWVVQFVSGFAWAGFNLCATNFVYDAVSPAKRTRCLSYFNLVNGVSLSLGAFLGGLILPYLPNWFGYKILMLCAMSSVFRLFVSLLMPIKLKEVRPVNKVHNRDLLLVLLGVKPLEIKYL